MDNIIRAESTNILNTFKNTDLRESTERIYTRMVNVEDNKKAICVDLAEIYNNGTWKEDFGDFGDYTMTMFNITKSTASRMRRVADRFITDINSPLNADMYTYNQLAVLVAVDNRSLENSNVNPDMTIKTLRKLVSMVKEFEGLPDTEAEEAEEAEEPTEETPEATEKESCNVATDSTKSNAHFATLKDLSMWVTLLTQNRENIEDIDVTFEVTTKHTEY